MEKITSSIYRTLTFEKADEKPYKDVILLCFVSAVVPLPVLFWGIDRMFRYIFYYTLGNILFDLNIQNKLKQINKYILLLLGILLLMLNFLFSYLKFEMDSIKIINAILGFYGVFLISFCIYKNNILQRLGEISLIILCVHGPLYRIIIKIISLIICTDTEKVRESLILCLITSVVTLALCSFVYRVLLRFFPFMLGKINYNSIRNED